MVFSSNPQRRWKTLIASTLWFWTKPAPSPRAHRWLRIFCALWASPSVQALVAIPGVEETAVSLEEKIAKAKLNQDVADEAFKAAVETAGYLLTEIK